MPLKQTLILFIPALFRTAIPHPDEIIPKELCTFLTLHPLLSCKLVLFLLLLERIAFIAAFWEGLSKE